MPQVTVIRPFTTVTRRFHLGAGVERGIDFPPLEFDRLQSKGFLSPPPKMPALKRKRPRRAA